MKRYAKKQRVFAYTNVVDLISNLFAKINDNDEKIAKIVYKYISIKQYIVKILFAVKIMNINNFIAIL